MISMLHKTKTERHSDICKEINALYAMKNHDYGDSFRQTFTEEGMAMPRIRLGDKLARFKSLTKSEVQEVKDESIRDTLIDLANYAIRAGDEDRVCGVGERSGYEPVRDLLHPAAPSAAERGRQGEG
ncbi:MAG: DUF1599 domain-containing protein [Faecalibacterium prausnitzii]|uniref:DUF1599 domain-containing protein n=1 Tax=Faecalibacterium prausnitzii TaxID=853 RepID=A0A9E1GL73_9FIRM|nr:DUF1599 domain-containing protein [Faecalibacterium prausnitzii]